MSVLRSPFRFLASHPNARLGLLFLATVVSVVVFGFVVVNAPPHPTKVVEVATVQSTSCGVFGNLTCHLVGTADGQVITVSDDSWVLMKAGSCYRLTLSPSDGSASNAQEVTCPTVYSVP